MREHSITVLDWNPVGRRTERRIDQVFVEAEKNFFGEIHFFTVGTYRETGDRYLLSCHSDFNGAWEEKQTLEIQINEALQNSMLPEPEKSQ